MIGMNLLLLSVFTFLTSSLFFQEEIVGSTMKDTDGLLIQFPKAQGYSK